MTLEDSLNKGGSVKVKNKSIPAKKAYDINDPKVFSSSPNVSSKVNRDSSISLKELFNNLFETLPEPK